VPDPSSDANSTVEPIGQGSRLSRNVFLLVGKLDCGRDGALRARMEEGDQVTQLGARSLSYVSHDHGGEDEKLTLILVAGPERILDSAGSLVLETPRSTHTLAPAQLGSVLSDLETLCNEGLAELAPQTRSRIADFCVTAAAEMGKISSEVGKSLGALRDALREPLPQYELGPDQPRGLWVDNIMAIDEELFYVQGWMRDEEEDVVRLTAVSPEGSRIELYDKLFRCKRPDLAPLFESLRELPGSDDEVGFICFFKTPAPSTLQTGWIMELENAAGARLETTAPPVVRGHAKVRDMILGDPMRQRFYDDELMLRHVFPAVSRIQTKVAEEATLKSVTQFGQPPDRPNVSLIVPLYLRLEHLEMQLAEFADDPQMHEADLIYVLDSPEQSDALLDAAEGIFPIYGVPFRIALLRANAGFAGANRIGASLAQGSLLLFMNSDIVPERPGWLAVMSEFYESKPGCGVLGPKLIYADETIQHAGMYLHQPIGSSVWLDAHYFKTLHRSMPAANVTRVVPAVSGACFMIAHELYEEVGGFRGIYVRGDYEDFDLCWRVTDRGYENWYLPDVELYHLEAQSYPSDLRLVSNRYNAWLHTHVWRDRIERLVDRNGSELYAGRLGQDR
jgi:O-antigen biosynthesis protein